MPTLALAYDIFARDRASTTFARVGASAESAGLKSEAAGRKMAGFAKTLGAIALVEAGKKSLEMAGDFQQSTNVLVTAAGETSANLAKVRQGIMDIATGTGTPLKELTDGMYQVEKAGYRGADGLSVLKTASQGAREEGANLATVTSAMTSIMASYHIPVKDNVSVMNQLKTAAGESKTTMEQFAGSLSTVLPVASANHISFAKVAGALATLTQHGTSADEATQELSNTIRNLAAPNMVAIKMMGQLGINSQDLSQKLGQRGVAGTLNYLSETVLRKMGPSGKVLLNTFLQSTSAGKAVQQMMAGMDPTVRKLAQSYIDGSINQEEWIKSMSHLTPQQASLARQFAVAENKARGFNTAIRQGMPGSVTYTEAIKKMTGGANGLNTTLQLTGESTQGTTERIKKISDAAKGAGKDVDGWASTQKLFNVQLDMFKQQVAVLGVKIGTALMPSVLGLVKQLGNMLSFVQQNQSWLVPLGKTVVTVAAAIWGINKATAAWKATMAGLSAIKGVFTGAASAVENFITRADAGAGSVKTWGSRLGGLAGFLGGPWGIAIGLGVTAITTFIGAQKAAANEKWKQSVEDYAGAFDQVKGSVDRATAALDANVRATTAKGLQDKGAFDLAEKLGISTKLLTDATLGNRDAQQQVNDVIKQNFALDPKLGKSYSDRHNAAQALSQMLQQQSTAELEAIRKANQMKGAMDASTVSTRLVADATKFYNGRLANLTASVKANGTSLADNTAKGRANQEAIHQAVLAVNAKAAADFASTLKTKGLSAALRVASTDLQHGKADIDKAAHAAGLNTGATDKMIKKYLETPKQVQTDVKTAGVGKAIGDINNVQNHIKGLSNKNVSIDFSTNAKSVYNKLGIRVAGVNSSGGLTIRDQGGPVPHGMTAFNTSGRTEYMHQPDAVNYYGMPIMQALNNRRIPKSAFEGLGGGGSVKRSIDAFFGRVPSATAGVPTVLNKVGMGIGLEWGKDFGKLAAKAIEAQVSAAFGGSFASGGALGHGALISKALHDVGMQYAIGYCLQFVRTLVGAPGGQYDAMTGWNQAHLKHHGDGNPPAGVPVWWGGGHGHVAFYVGGGKIVSTDLPTMGRVGLVNLSTPSKLWGKPYLGWTGDLNGVVLKRDRGGIVPNGAMAGNTSGRDEYMLPPGGIDLVQQMISALQSGGRSAPLVNVENVSSGVDLEAFARQAEFRARQGTFG